MTDRQTEIIPFISFFLKMYINHIMKEVRDMATCIAMASEVHIYQSG